MKKYILLALSLMAANMAVMAQNPNEALFSVEYTTAEGKDSTLAVSAIDVNAFHFIGGAGVVYNPVTEDSLAVANQDLFIWLENLTSASVVVKLGLSEEIERISGYCLSKSPNASVSESTFKGVADSRLKPYDWAEREIASTKVRLQKTLDEGVSYTLLPHGTDPAFYVSIEGLEPATTYYIRPYTLLNGYIMYGGEESFSTPQDDAAQ